MTVQQPDIEAVLRAAQVLSEARQHTNLLAKAVEIVLSLSGASRVVFARWEDGSYWIRAHGSAMGEGTNRHVNAALVEATRDDLPWAVHDLVSRSGTVFVVDEPAQDARVSADPYFAVHHPRSVLCFQTVNSRLHQRFMYFEHDERPEAFSPQLIQVLRALSEHVGIALENAALLQRLEDEVAWHRRSEVALRVSEANLLRAKDELEREREKLRHLATRDWLTGLWNRWAVFEIVSSTLAHAVRERRSVTLMMVDIDHFKRINDQRGHPAGDAVLRDVARRLSSAVRPSDAVGRYGGEEFLIVLPDCGEPAALATAERLRTAIERRPFADGESALRVTCSVGVSWTKDGLDEGERLLRDADAALYRAKHAGGNRVEVAAPGREAVRDQSFA